MGDNEWVIVDSCMQRKTKEPTPLTYLKKLGVNISESVKLFVITHWHSDHISGAGQIAKECASASICFSQAFLEEEFLTFVSIYSGLERSVFMDRETCGTREIASIIKTIKNRSEQNSRSPFLPYILASADKRIYQSKGLTPQREIWALSPSSKAVTNSLSEIARLIPVPSEDEIRGVVPKPDQNQNAVVLLIKYGELFSILLGADLIETSDPLTGWSGIVDSPNRPSGKSGVFKIPHHGSKNAHSHKLWQNMMETEAVGILTTKIGGRSNIPKKSDINRLKKYTSRLFGTLEPLTKKQRHDRIVEKAIQGILKNRIPLNGDMGQIQMRMNHSSGIKVRLKEPATEF